MSDQRIDTAKIRACSALLGEPSVTVVWQLADEVDRLAAESAQKDARIAELETAEEESDAVRMGMAKLLTGVANALRGDPPELTSWSWHDLPERAAAAINAITVMEMAARDSARMVAEFEAATRWRPMIECPVDNVPIVITRKGGIVEVDSACMVRCDLAGGDQSALGWLPIPTFEEPKP